MAHKTKSVNDVNRTLRTVGVMGFLVVLIIILFNMFTYSVKPNTTALVVRFGKVHGEPVTTVGLHGKAPIIDSVIQIYTGDNPYDMPVSDVITSDKKSMIADNFVIWKVVDVQKFYRTLGGSRPYAEQRIDAAVYNATKNTISSMTQDEIIASRGTTLTDLLTKESNSDISQYGIEVKVATIKALDLPSDNKAAVYTRMISERENIAASYTAKGAAEAQKIQNDADKTVSITKANAEAESAKIIAEGEAEYMRILSSAYNEEGKADFYKFLRGLDSMSALKGSNKTLILDKNSEYAKLLYGMQN